MKSRKFKLIIGASVLLLIVSVVGLFATSATEKKETTVNQNENIQESSVLSEEYINIAALNTTNSDGKTKDEIYADQNTIIFHENNGLFIYSIPEKTLTDAIAWETFGYPDGVTIDIPCEVVVDQKGKKVYVQSGSGILHDIYYVIENNKSARQTNHIFETNH